MQAKQKGFTPGKEREEVEEFEDDEGNVYDKKTYELLKAQGLI